MTRPFVVLGLLVLGVLPVQAQEPGRCRVLCAPEFNIEPTFTFTNIVRSPRTTAEDGFQVREPRESEFEVILSLGLPTRLSWLAFTVEAIFLPFDADSTPELEFETNFVWLSGQRTRGWVSSHFDVVDKFSPAERLSDRRAYTHKLNFELDTSVAMFKWLGERRWLRGVEMEGSLDYVASGLPKAGHIADGRRYLDNASPWSFSWSSSCPWRPSRLHRGLASRSARTMEDAAHGTASTHRSAARAPGFVARRRRQEADGRPLLALAGGGTIFTTRASKGPVSSPNASTTT